jgi:uncharacterized protein (TIGR00369 family)
MVRAMFRVQEEAARGAFLEPSLIRLSGLELLRTYLNGNYERAPITHLTGMQPTQVEAGAATSVMPLSDWLRSSRGAISEGVLIIPSDSALGSAVHTTLPEATLYTTAELSLTWLRPVGPGGEAIATGRAIYTSATMAVSQVQVTDQQDQLLAHGASRCTVFPPLPEVPSAPTPAPPSPPIGSGESDPYLRPAQGAVLDREIWQVSSGREVLDAQLRGELPQPPVHELFGLTLHEVDEGMCVFSLPCTRWLCGPVGYVQGGVIALLAHTALQGAVQTTVATASGCVPMDMKVNLLRPVPPDGRDLVARGQVVHRGRSYAIANTEVTNADGKRVALATGSSAYRQTP